MKSPNRKEVFRKHEAAVAPAENGPGDEGAPIEGENGLLKYKCATTRATELALGTTAWLRKCISENVHLARLPADLRKAKASWRPGPAVSAYQPPTPSI
ncbi:hypothetical protein JHW43_004897 [Diplocarpon mali]|nr:hypothetical protein JHW43_004897 [Diplocarpon mali]